MASLTNNVALSFAIESSPGVLSGDQDFVYLEPNDIGSFGATISTVSRNPISNDRMPKKGAITDLDASMDFTSDLTRSAYSNFIEGFLMAAKKEQPSTVVSSCSTTAFTHPALSAALNAGDLVYSREMTNSGNNGLFLVNGTPTTTTTPVDATLVAEASAPTNSKIEFCGFQAASGDLEVNADGDLESTAFDFTADVSGEGLIAGMMIYIGDGTTDHSFATAGSGSARIRSVSANKLTLDKQYSSTWAADSGAAKTIRVFVPSWIRNVSLDDSDFLNRTYQFEAAFTQLDINGDGTANETGYEYAIGNVANQMTVNLPLADKATVNWAFVGLDQEEASGTRKTTTGDWVYSYDTDAFNTTSDFAQLYFYDESDNPLGAYFKDMTVTINNNRAPEKILGQLGAYSMNIGDFTLDISTQVLFENLAAINAVRNNTTTSLSFAVENDDGALHFDFPSMTLGSATKNFPRNETIKINIDAMPFKDSYFGYALSCSEFAYLPIAG